MNNFVESPIPLKQAVLEARERLAAREERHGIDKNWDTFESHISDYLGEFQAVLGETDVISDLQAKESPVVIDFLSSTRALNTLFQELPQKNKLGIAVGRSDYRSLMRRTIDEDLGIYQIVGDLTAPKTWQQIEDKLAGRKADLILERGLAAVTLYMPRNRDFYGLVGRKAWRLLSRDNGSILAHLPSSTELAEYGVDMSEWRRLLDSMGIDYSYDLETAFTSILRLTRTPTSPEKLPMLA